MQTMSLLPINIARVDIKHILLNLPGFVLQKKINITIRKIKQLIEIRSTLSKSKLPLEELATLFKNLFNYSKEFSLNPSKCINECIENHNGKSITTHTFKNVFVLQDKHKIQQLYNIF